MILIKVGARVRTIDHGALVHGRKPDKPEAVGVVRAHYQPYGTRSKLREPPYFVEFPDGQAAWYAEHEVERVKSAKTRGSQ